MDGWTTLGLALVLVGAGIAPVADVVSPSPANEEVRTASTTHHVHIEDFAMDPDPLEIEVGDTVVWHNHDGATHTATEDDGAWNTGSLGTDETASITFDEAASYSYYCQVHPGSMNGFGLEVLEPNDPPTVDIQSPTEGDVLSGEVDVAGNASDPDGSLDRVEVRIDEGDWQTASGTTDWTFAWDTSQVADGSHTIEARSFDGIEYSPIDAVEVNTDNPQPDLKVAAFDAEASIQEATLDATITNVGEAEASSTTLEVRYEGDYARGLAAEVSIPRLPVGATHQLQTTWDTSDKVGQFQLTAQVDPAGEVPDFNPSNDEGQDTVCVPSAEGVTCLVPGVEAPG